MEDRASRSWRYPRALSRDQVRRVLTGRALAYTPIRACRRALRPLGACPQVLRPYPLRIRIKAELVIKTLND